MHTFSRRTWIWVKTTFFRITISKTTACFFLFSFLHCLLHSVVQSVLFSFDQDANTRVSDILTEAQVPKNNVAFLKRKDGNFTLRLCQHVPVTQAHEDLCELIFQSGVGNISVPSGFRKRDVNALDEINEGSLALGVTPVANSSGVVGVRFSSNDVNHGSTVVLDEQCTRVLSYADQVLKNSKREELALIGSEFWLLGISIFAIMYDSIPHLLAGFFMRVLSTGWSGYAIWRTLDIHTRFSALITNGACGVDLFPNYFHNRFSVQIADLVLNVIALLLSCYLVWRLVKTYAACMFTRIGAPKHIMRLYRFFLGVFICLQMSVYLLVTATSLWVDQLINGALVKISTHNSAYLAFVIIAIILLLPWIALGWFSIRREMRRTVLAFLAIGVLYTGAWAAMYYSQVFRWTWIQWPFLASVTVAAQIVQLASIVVGAICRRNFHRGLAQYLHVDNLLTKADFEPEVFPHDAQGDIEKHAFQVDFKIVSLNFDSSSDTGSDEERDSTSKMKPGEL